MLIIPALLRKTTPASAKKTMIPKAEVQTIRPAMHLSRNMNMKDINTAAPTAQSTHFQF